MDRGRKEAILLLNGTVAAVARDNKKVLDYKVMSKCCRSCAIWDKRKGTPEYEKWKIDHKCSINHTKSAGAMESSGTLSIFNSSLENYNMRYSHYIGDGDTDSFRKIVEAKPYGDNMIPTKTRMRWACTKTPRHPAAKIKE